MTRYFGRPASRWAWRSVVLHSGIALALWAGPAPAHEFWLGASSYRATRDTRVDISAAAGEGFSGEPKRYADSRTAALTLHTDRQTDLMPLAAEADSNFARVTAPDDSGMVISFLSRFDHLSLPAARFNAYLVSEGLDEVARSRLERGDGHREGKERYRRCAKIWIEGRPALADRACRPVGLPFEIVPLTDPAPGGSISIRLLFEGRPAAGRLVQAWRASLNRSGGAFRGADRDSTGTVTTVRTDARGEATLHLPGPGEWLISTLLMIPSREADADWESYWASFTFGRP